MTIFINMEIPKFKPRRKSRTQKKPVKRGRYKKEFVELVVSEMRSPRAENKEIPSLGIGSPIGVENKKRYSGKMAEREKLAQEEIERKKKRVAPMGNKMAYQYIGENPPPEILRGLGRKL